MTDIRIKTSLFAHRKTKRLRKMLGDGALIALMTLWASAAENRPDGDLTGLSADDIALDADWDGNAEQFVTALGVCGWLDGTDGHYQLHDWADHQGYVIHAPERQERARRAAEARWNARSNAQFETGNAPSMPQACYGHASSMHQACGEHTASMHQACSEHASSIRQACGEHAQSNAPDPVPDPSPDPVPDPALSPPPPITPRPQTGVDEPLPPAPAEQPPPPAVPEGRRGAQPQGNQLSRQRQALGNLWTWARGDWLRTAIADGMTKLYLDGARSSGKPSAEFITGTASNYEEALLKYRLTADEKDRVKAAFAGAMSHCRGWPQAQELCDFLPRRDPQRQVGIPEETDRASPGYSLTEKFEEEKRQRYGKRTEDAAGAEAAN